ncbi:MAG: hypothetical protein HC897_01890 [Thermoanaerobaculia bacterium]|nr:hypothetical protein [Thermoanaerobaculia bacterium]
MPTLPKAPPARSRLPTTIAALLLLALSPGSPCRAELVLELTVGIDQNRNEQREGFWTRQWVRSLPPGDRPYLLTVQAPKDWLEPPEGNTTPAEIAVRNADAVATLRTVIAQTGLQPADDPLLLAGRVVALLRPVEIGAAQAPARYQRLWLLWETLADATQSDTRSTSFAALQTLRELGVEAQLARYPSQRGTHAYGILLDASTRPADDGWAFAVGNAMLLPMARSAPPVDTLGLDQISAWSWEQILAPDWDPGDVPKPGETDPLADALKQLADAPTLPELCRQAKALDLECVPKDPTQTRNQTLVAISAAVVILLLGWFFLMWRHHRQRLRRVEAQKLKRREENPDF